MGRLRGAAGARRAVRGLVPRWPQSRGFWEELAAGTRQVQPGCGQHRKHLCLANMMVVCRLSMGAWVQGGRGAQNSSCPPPSPALWLGPRQPFCTPIPPAPVPIAGNLHERGIIL